MRELQKAAQEIVKVSAELLYKDNHYWSTRGCQTCLAITTLLGFDFGCIRYAKERIPKGASDE
jgi:hypothetical protein